MDLLDRVRPVATPLVERIDAVLVAAGAPPHHPIWTLLREVGALPGDVVTHIDHLTAPPLAAAGHGLRLLSRAYVAAVDSVPGTDAWRGMAAATYAQRWAGLSEFLGDADHPGSMAGRLAVTAGYVEDVADWVAHSRHHLAGTLAECLGSRSAAELATIASDAATAAAQAAADLGAHILDAGATILRDGRQAHDRHADRLGELVFVGPSTPEMGAADCIAFA